VVEFYLKLKLILSIILYLTYIGWEIDNFVIESDIFRRFFICKNILKKLSCYHDNYFRYFMFGKYNGFVSKARVFAWMYFLVGGNTLIVLIFSICFNKQTFILSCRHLDLMLKIWLSISTTGLTRAQNEKLLWKNSTLFVI
jgi:hypothetical protein